MKNLFVICLFLVTNLTMLNAQEIGNNFYFKSTLSHTLSAGLMKLNNNTPIDKEVNINKGAIVKVSMISGDTIYFTYLDYSLGSLKNKIYNLDSKNGVKTFSMNKGDFEKITSPYYNFWRGWNYGAYTIPARLRGLKGNFEFESNLSLGANISGRIGLHRSKKFIYTDIVLGVSITKVNLNPDNSILGNTAIPDNEFSEISTLSPTAFTTSLGLLITFTEKINFGIYSGFDFISSSDQKAEWAYNKKPWLGIGINIIIGDANESNNNIGQGKN